MHYLSRKRKLDVTGLSFQLFQDINLLSFHSVGKVPKQACMNEDLDKKLLDYNVVLLNFDCSSGSICKQIVSALLIDCNMHD